MSFIQREIERLNALLRDVPEDSPAHQPLHAAQQALSWASDPDCFASPSATIHKFFGVGNGGTKGTGLSGETHPSSPPQQPPSPH